MNSSIAAARICSRVWVQPIRRVLLLDQDLLPRLHHLLLPAGGKQSLPLGRGVSHFEGDFLINSLRINTAYPLLGAILENGGSHARQRPIEWAAATRLRRLLLMVG